jgi:hypothetical protein
MINGAFMLLICAVMVAEDLRPIVHKCRIYVACNTHIRELIGGGREKGRGKRGEGRREKERERKYPLTTAGHVLFN